MCSSKAKENPGEVARINGRPVLQPACNRVVPTLDRRNSLPKKLPPKSPLPQPQPPPSMAAAAATSPRARLLGVAAAKSSAPPTPPLSPKTKSPRPPAIKRGSDVNGLNSSSEKAAGGDGGGGVEIAAAAAAAAAALSYSSSMIVEAPGSIAAVRREQVALQQAQRKMRIAHYGRAKSGKLEPKIVPLTSENGGEEKRCSFITPNSDPLYVTYHDGEWGVPVHDDGMLFELLVLSGAQVGSDWTSILKKREDFRNAFCGFDAEFVASFTEKQISSVSAEYGIDISRVRGVVDNSIRILEVKKDFGSFDKYIWGFVNHKPISTHYKFGHKIPVKTSKSETISKDMVRRGFRSVGPTAVHSFMQAAGLTNDHLLSCHRHRHCAALANPSSELL